MRGGTSFILRASIFASLILVASLGMRMGELERLVDGTRNGSLEEPAAASLTGSGGML